MPEIHWGIEQIIDLLAEELGMDKVEFRLKNCVREGSIIATGSKMHPVGLSECIEKAAAAINWGKKEPASAPHKRRGKGLAIMWKAPAMPPNAGSSAWVRFNEDATVTVGIGGQEIGQGAFTVMAQMAAATLGVPYGLDASQGPDRYAVQPLRMADRRQPPDMVDGQRGRRRGAGRAPSGA